MKKLIFSFVLLAGIFLGTFTIAHALSNIVNTTVTRNISAQNEYPNYTGDKFTADHFVASSTTATSTFANGVSLSGGCVSVGGSCLGSGGSLTGGSLNALTYWTSNTTVGATSSPTIGYLTATSTTATSTFANGINLTKGCFSVSLTCIGSTAPAGSSGYLQFNNSGSFGADSNLFWDNSNKLMSLGLNSSLTNTVLRINTTGTQRPLVFTGTGVSVGSANNTSTGVMMGMGYNSANDQNKQLWIGSSGQIGDDTHTIFRFITGFDIPLIDGVSAAGSTRRNIDLAYYDNNVGIGYDVVTASQSDIVAKLDIIGNSTDNSTLGFRLRAGSGGSIGNTLMQVYDDGTLSLPDSPYAGNGDQYLCVDNAGDVSPQGVLCNPSTIRVKQNVKALSVDALSILSTFQPVSFQYTKASHQKSTNPTGTQWGFIAEYMASTSLNLAAYDTKGQVATLDDRAISAVVVKAVQQLWGIVQGLAGRLSGDEARITRLEQEVQVLQTQINKK